jgi:DNA-binding LytR/AlgR family response regulator
MPTAIIADDEPMMRAALRDHLAALWPELNVVAEAEDGPTALLKVESHKPDFAFLDIRMPGMTGMEVAKSLTVASRVVFVTAHDQHAVEAFEASALDYVLKPLEMPRMARTVAKLRKSMESGAPSMDQIVRALSRTGMTGTEQPARRDQVEWLQVAVGKEVRMLHVDDVMYFESDTKYTRVVSADCDGLIRLTLKELTENLESVRPGKYLQTHRSTVVNRQFVRSVHRREEVIELELKGRAERLKVSTANHHLFRAM